MSYPRVRPRRLRRTAALRWRDSGAPGSSIAVFVKEGLSQPRPISSLPGVVQHSRESLRKAAAEERHSGIGGLMLFGVPSTRDAAGSGHGPRRHPHRGDPGREGRGAGDAAW